MGVKQDFADQAVKFLRCCVGGRKKLIISNTVIQHLRRTPLLIYQMSCFVNKLCPAMPVAIEK